MLQQATILHLLDRVSLRYSERSAGELQNRRLGPNHIRKWTQVEGCQFVPKSPPNTQNPHIRITRREQEGYSALWEVGEFNHSGKGHFEIRGEGF
jgi:hypothetical protein